MGQKKTEKRYSKLLQAAERLQETDPQFYEDSLESYLDRSVPTHRVTLLTNPINAGMKKPYIGYALQKTLLEADESAVIQTPYASGSIILLDTLSEAAKNRDVTFLTNSPMSTPNFMAFSSYYAQREKFLETGIDIREYVQSDSIHGKSMVIDDYLSVVGSYNLDSRSMYIDTESVLLIDSPDLAQELLGVMDDLMARSLQVGADNKYTDLNSSDVVDEASKVKIFFLGYTYHLFKYIQFLL